MRLFLLFEAKAVQVCFLMDMCKENILFYFYMNSQVKIFNLIVHFHLTIKTKHVFIRMTKINKSVIGNFKLISKIFRVTFQ